jgi:hypothetical protein
MKPLIEINLPQEELLILFCCRKLLTHNAIRAVDDILTKSLNWDLILSMAKLHNINALLYFTLSQCHNINCIAIDVLKKLEISYHHNAFKNLLYRREFNDIVMKFNGAGIKTIPLKGIAFVHSLYVNNIALRNLSDIDLLVENKNIAGAEAILLAMGYKRLKTSIGNSQRRFHLNFLRSKENLPIVVELHWDVDYCDSPFNINIEEFWQRSQEFLSGNINFYQFSIEDSIIFNSFHILREVSTGPDELFPLKNFCDIAMIIGLSADQISWDCIMQRSQEYKILRPVAFVLLLVRELLKVETIPPLIIEALHNTGYQDDFGCRAVKEYVFPHQHYEKKMIPFWIVELSVKGTLREKVKVFLNLPNAILNLYHAKYYSDPNNSAIKTILSLFYHYTKKTIKTITRYIVAPRKTINFQKQMTITNQKAREVIKWVRG